MSDDAELIRRYAEQSSEAAFAELVRRHLGLVYSAALRRLGGDAHGAADVAQVVFVKLAREAARLGGHAALTAWFYTATRNAAVDAIRSSQRRAKREQEALTMNDGLSAAGAGETEMEWARLRPVLDAAMDELGERDREAVLLRYFEERPFAEIGAALEVSEDAARMRVERALEKLRAVLARRGVTSTGAALGVVLANQAVGAAPAGLAGTVATAAGVVGGGGTLLGIFTFMSTGKIVVGVAIVCAAVGIGSAVYQAGEVTRANDAVVAALRERDAVAVEARTLAGKLRAAEDSARAATERVASLEAKSGAGKKAGPGNGTGANVEVSAVPRTEAVERENPWTKPGYAKAWLEQFRAGIGLRFGPLYRTLGLSEAQIAKFEAVLTEGQQGLVDVWTQAGEQGLRPAGDSSTATSVARLTSEPLKIMEEQLKALLGETGFARYQQFDKIGGARSLIMELAGGLYHTETPLTGAQGDALGGLIAANTTTVSTPMASDGLKPMFSLEEVTDWVAVVKLAPGVLSPAQVAAFQRLNEAKRAELEMNRILNEAAASSPSK